MDGRRLTFHLAGINNQNFIMRDEETGTYWQQISGLAISGPLKGRQLTLVPSDELNFATWRSEQPEGTVLNDLPKYVSEYAKQDWDVRMKRVSTVMQFAEHGMKARDLMLGIQAFGASRAFLYDSVLKEKLVKDHVGSEPVVLVVAEDNQSVRVFRDRIPGCGRLARLLPPRATETRCAVHGRLDRQRVELPGLRRFGQGARCLSGAGAGPQGLLVRLAELQSEDHSLGKIITDFNQNVIHVNHKRGTD